MPREYDIRLAWQITPMEPKSKSPSVQHAPDGYLRVSVLRTDTRHQRAALGSLVLYIDLTSAHSDQLLSIGFHIPRPFRTIPIPIIPTFVISGTIQGQLPDFAMEAEQR